MIGFDLSWSLVYKGGNHFSVYNTKRVSGELRDTSRELHITKPILVSVYRGPLSSYLYRFSSSSYCRPISDRPLCVKTVWNILNNEKRKYANKKFIKMPMTAMFSRCIVSIFHVALLGSKARGFCDRYRPRYPVPIISLEVLRKSLSGSEHSRIRCHQDTVYRYVRGAAAAATSSMKRRRRKVIRREGTCMGLRLYRHYSRVKDQE